MRNAFTFDNESRSKSRPKSPSTRVIVALALAASTLGAAPPAAAGQNQPGAPVQIILAPGVVPRAGMQVYGTDECTYLFDGVYWQPQRICRQFPDPGNAQVFDLYDRYTREPLAQIDLREAGWVRERKASGPAANYWFKVPLRDVLTHGQVGPNNTWVLLDDGRWYKQLDLQREADMRYQRELMARMTPEAREQYIALRARLAESEHRMKMFALGAVLVPRY